MYEIVLVNSSTGERKTWVITYKRRGYAMRVARSFIPAWRIVEVWYVVDGAKILQTTMYKDMQ